MVAYSNVCKLHWVNNRELLKIFQDRNSMEIEIAIILLHRKGIGLVVVEIRETKPKEIKTEKKTYSYKMWK